MQALTLSLPALGRQMTVHGHTFFAPAHGTSYLTPCLNSVPRLSYIIMSVEHTSQNECFWFGKSQSHQHKLLEGTAGTSDTKTLKLAF